MMNREVTFRELCQLLKNMKFKHITQPTHVLFEHADSNTQVVLRPYDARELVNPTDLAIVRKTLDERGLMAADSFEHFMRKKPA